MTTPSAEDLERINKADVETLASIPGWSRDKAWAWGWADGDHDHAEDLAKDFAAVRAEEREKVVAEIVAWVLSQDEHVNLKVRWARDIERKWIGK